MGIEIDSTSVLHLTVVLQNSLCDICKMFDFTEGGGESQNSNIIRLCIPTKLVVYLSIIVIVFILYWFISFVCLCGHASISCFTIEKWRVQE